MATIMTQCSFSSDYIMFPQSLGGTYNAPGRSSSRPQLRRQYASSSTVRCQHFARSDRFLHQLRHCRRKTRDDHFQSTYQVNARQSGEVDLADDLQVHERVRELIEDSQKWPEQRSEEWFAKRNGMLTASDVSAVLGTNRHMSAGKLLNQKLGLEPPARLNAALRHGTLMEPEARKLYEARTGESCLEFGLKSHDRWVPLYISIDALVILMLNWGQIVKPRLANLSLSALYEGVSPNSAHYNCRYPWLGGSPDGVTLSGRLLEIKCPYSRRASDATLRHR